MKEFSTHIFEFCSKCAIYSINATWLNNYLVIQHIQMYFIVFSTKVLFENVLSTLKVLSTQLWIKHKGMKETKPDYPGQTFNV